MRYISKKAFILYGLIFLFLISRVFMFQGTAINNYTNLANPLFWLFTAILSYLFTRIESSPRMRNKYDIIQSITIVMIIYCMVYFSLGLIFGYERSPYSHDFVAIVKNLWIFVSIILFQEFVRFQLIKLVPKKITHYALITLLFIVAEINFWNIGSNFNNNADAFKYISQVLLPLVVKNCLFTYLCTMAGSIPSIVYRTIFSLLTILLPIFPSINWLVMAMMEIILSVIIALYANYQDMKVSRNYTKREVRKEKLSSYIPYIVVLVLLVCFIGGLFKYQPIAVLSNSMVPEFSRGDVVIMRKIDDETLDNLQKDTILYYSKEGKLIVHRIKSIKRNGKKLEIVTKGDNNNTDDPWIVTEKDIIGTVKHMIPYIGYPSVWVNELLK